MNASKASPSLGLDWTDPDVELIRIRRFRP